MVKKRTRSLLEEINRIDIRRDRNHFIESKAVQVFAAVENLTDLIKESYDEETAIDLNKRLMNAIRTQDPRKFERGIRKVNESQRHTRGKS